MLLFAKGLVKACTFAYYSARLNGSSHEMAMEWALRSRYQSSDSHIHKVRQMHSYFLGKDEQEELEWLLVCIYAYEQKGGDLKKLKGKDLSKLMSIIENAIATYR